MDRLRAVGLWAFWLGVCLATPGCPRSSLPEGSTPSSSLLERALENLGQSDMQAISTLCSQDGQGARFELNNVVVHRCFFPEPYLDLAPWSVDLQLRGSTVELVALSVEIDEGGRRSTLVAALRERIERQCGQRIQPEESMAFLSRCVREFAAAALVEQRLATPQLRVTLALASSDSALVAFKEFHDFP